MKWIVVMALCATFLMFLLSGNLVSGSTRVPFGEVNVKLNVVALDGVGGHGVGNVTRMVEGVLAASKANSTTFLISVEPTGGFAHEFTIGEVKINTNATVIHDWGRYKEIVETGSNAIIVNAHGETIPVPAGYLKEEWTDKIAEAMAYRNVTWVHTGGYPLYYYYLQELGEGRWGDQGFKQLMSNMGKGNVTCYPPGPETDKISLSLDAQFALTKGWGLDNAFWAEGGRPLKASDFKNDTYLPVWGSLDSYMTGAIIKFAEANTHSFGFYVHIGTNQTYYYNGVLPTDRDYWRGYAGAAAAIYSFTFRVASETAIAEAETAIVKAESEGRTKGLDQAKQFLQQAKDDYSDDKFFGNLLIQADQARKAADSAVKPSFIEAYASYIIALGVVGSTTAGGLILRWRRNSKKSSDTNCTPQTRFQPSTQSKATQNLSCYKATTSTRN